MEKRKKEKLEYRVVWHGQNWERPFPLKSKERHYQTRRGAENFFRVLEEVGGYDVLTIGARPVGRWIKIHDR